MTASDVANRLLENLPWVTIPASLVSAAGMFYNFWANLPATIDNLTAVEGFVKVAIVAIGAIAPIISASGLVLSIWMAGKYRLFKAGLDRDLEMAKIGKAPSSEIQRLPADFTFGGKSAKHDEDTVDYK